MYYNVHVCCVAVVMTGALQILNYLRDTADAIDVQFPQSHADLQALLREAQYYRLNDLRHRITQVATRACFYIFPHVLSARITTFRYPRF
jgi:hypothetical protein